MNVKDYIESGILETYVMGVASESEVSEVLRYKALYPEVKDALKELEIGMELIAGQMAIKPPPDIWTRISNDIDGLIKAEPQALRTVSEYDEFLDFTSAPKPPDEKYIEVESSNTYMRIHKAWRWVFAAVFVLGKIFLGFAIYYYLENRQAQDQIKDLKAQVKEYRVK